jgi:hypothetical protein
MKKVIFELNKINAWEYYFEQPTIYKLEDVYQSKNVIIASGISPYEAHPYTMNMLLQILSKRKMYFNIIDKQIKIKPEMLEICNKAVESLLMNKRVLGVSTRGKTLIGVKGHAIQPETKMLLKDVKSKCKEWNCQYVFLASEEQNIVDAFQNEFKQFLILDNRERFKYDSNDKVISSRANDKYIGGVEYLTTVYILSKCTSIIGTKIGSTLGAIELNNNEYENVFLYNLGLYK